MPGLGLARIFLWTELHVQCLLLGGKRVGDDSYSSRAQNIPAVASFETDVLCLYTAAAVVSSLSLLLLPHARPRPAVIPFILLLEPQGQVCFRLLENKLACVWNTLILSLSLLPLARGHRPTPGS